MNEQPLDLRRILRAVGRRWLLILVLVWVGCVGGYLLASQQPAVYVARASVLLPPSPVDSEGNQIRNIDTQVNIARNGNILERAGRAVSPPLGPRTMRKQIRVTALTADILEVQAQASSGRDAALLADAVAKEYVGEATDVSSKLAATAVSGLVQQKDKVELRLQETKAEIDATTGLLNSLPPSSPERARQAAVADSLQLDEVEAARQLAILSDKIAEARLQDQISREGIRLLSPAIRPSQPSGLQPITLTLGGALFALLGSVVLALVLERRDGRLRSRSEIADVVAAPVLASLETPRRVSLSGCRSMLEHWEPRPLQSWALHQALVRMSAVQGRPPSNIVVVGLPGDVAGPLLALQLAVFAASLDTRTALVIPTVHPTAGRLRSACNRGVGGGEVRPRLSTRSELIDRESEGDREAFGITVTFVVADESGSDLASIPPRAVTTLGVSSGFATADDLATTALACLDAGHPLVGIFVANPDPSDPSAGDFPSDPLRMPGQVLLESPVARAVASGPPTQRGQVWDPPVGEQVEGEQRNGDGVAEERRGGDAGGKAGSGNGRQPGDRPGGPLHGDDRMDERAADAASRLPRSRPT